MAQQPNPISANAMSPNPISVLGFIGLGVMGEPMCGHLARRAGKPILAHDLRPEPLERLASNAVTAATLAEIARARRPDPAVAARRQGDGQRDRRAGAASAAGPVRGGYQHLVGGADAGDRRSG